MDDLPQYLQILATERDLLSYDEPVRRAILRACELVALARAMRPITIDDLPHVPTRLLQFEIGDGR